MNNNMLKKQEPKPPVIKENAYGWKFHYCPCCRREFVRPVDYCDKCGYGKTDVKIKSVEKYKKFNKPERFMSDEEKQEYYEHYLVLSPIGRSCRSIHLLHSQKQ